MPTKRIVRLLALLSLFAFGAAFLAACNTIEGVGEDISALGRGLKRASGDRS